MNTANLKEIVLQAEQKALHDLYVKEELQVLFEIKDNIVKFAEKFYFIRYNFYKINFIAGSRCPSNEIYWRGLVHNLMEELGGIETQTHNQLYRNFLQSLQIDNEEELTPTSFSIEFNKKWEDYCFNAPIDEVLAAIGVYEILDIPDYKLLLDLIETSSQGKKIDLLFFKVHSEAEHFEMFEDFISRMIKDGKLNTVNKAIDFVIETQKFMWEGLLLELKQKSQKEIN